MRTSFLTLTVLALAASTMTAASAFNYATISARTIAADVVGDANAYLAITYQDAEYDCFTAESGTTGKIDVTWDVGSTCGGGGGTGINGGGTYYFHDVLKITNKGLKALNYVAVNMSDTIITTQLATSPTAMLTTGTYAQSSTVSTLAVGSSIYVGFKIDGSATTDLSTLSKSMTLAARSST